MPGGTARFPEAVLLRRADGTGYGFFYHGVEDFLHAAESFSRPILRSFVGTPIPGQPEPHEHLRSAIATFLSQAFDKVVPVEVGAEGVSRAVAACVRATFGDATPRVVLIERKAGGGTSVRPGIEFMRHPGHPMAVVLDADTHGGDALFFASAEEFVQIASRPASAQCWVPQIIHRLYARTPSVVAGRPLLDKASGKTNVEFRGHGFGMPAPFEERTVP